MNMSSIYIMYISIIFVVFFFFKQKTAYEMRISDWSSDVCSSDLFAYVGNRRPLYCLPLPTIDRPPGGRAMGYFDERYYDMPLEKIHNEASFRERDFQIGRASRRERVCQYV